MKVDGEFDIVGSSGVVDGYTEKWMKNRGGVGKREAL